MKIINRAKNSKIYATHIIQNVFIFRIYKEFQHTNREKTGSTMKKKWARDWKKDFKKEKYKWQILL